MEKYVSKTAQVLESSTLSWKVLSSWISFFRKHCRGACEGGASPPELISALWWGRDVLQDIDPLPWGWLEGVKSDQNPQAGHPWPQIASSSAPQKMDRGEQDPMACRVAPVGSSLTERHLGLTHLLGCTEYSQGGALPGPSTEHTPFAKLVAVPVSKALSELLGTFTFQVSKECSMQACSPGCSWAVGLEAPQRHNSKQSL